MPFGIFACLGFTVVGVLVLAWVMQGLSQRGGDRASLGLGTQTACPHCRHINPTYARYCAQCGRRVG